MAFSYLNSTVSSLFAQLDDADSNVIRIGEHELSPTTVEISKLSIDMLTPDLLKAFSFNNAWAVQPAHEYRAKSIVVFTSVARINNDGLLTECAFSAWGARQRRVDNKFPLGKTESCPVIKSDVFLQADYYSLGISDMVLPVPVYALKGYTGESDDRIPLSIRLTSVATNSDDKEATYDSVRTQYNDVVRAAAIANGIPANEQFEVCVFGFPSKTELVNQKDKPGFYGVSLNMGYMVGVRTIKGSSRVINKHSINLNHMVGGVSLESKLLSEIAAMSTGAVTTTIVKATAPVVVTAPVAAPVTTTAPVATPTPVVTLSTTVPVADVELDEDGMEIKVMKRPAKTRPAPVAAPTSTPATVVTPAPIAESVVAPAPAPAPAPTSLQKSLMERMRRAAAVPEVKFEAE